MPVALLSDIVIIVIIVMITLMIYHGMKFLLLPNPTLSIKNRQKIKKPVSNESKI